MTNPFAEGGADYARSRPNYPAELVTALAAACAAQERALDVGCGNGQLSVALADAFAEVIGTDPSESQIASAKRHPRVRYRIEAAESIGEPDQSLDLVVAAQAAHWFDLDRFYSEARRVLKPGGVLALVSYGVPELEGDVGEAFQTFYWGPFHQYWPNERRHVEDGYRSLEFPCAEFTLPPLAIERHWTLAELVAYIETWSAARAARKSDGVTMLEDGLADLATAWGDSAQVRLIRWPISLRLGSFNRT